MALERTEDVDLSKSTGAYPQASSTAPIVVDDAGDNAFARSTGAYPMSGEPRTIFVDRDVDYAKSTGAYPMYDDELAARTAQGVPLDVPVQVVVTTPGPVSTGDPTMVARQRADLGLSEDPSGESDAGYEARPSTVAGKGFDGVARESHEQAEADAAVSEEAQAKTIAPPPARAVRRRTQADEA
jgi:hypothetical protein